MYLVKDQLYRLMNPYRTILKFSEDNVQETPQGLPFFIVPNSYSVGKF